MGTVDSTHLALGLLLSAGLLLGLGASRAGLPRVTAYMLAGIALSPALLGDVLGIRLGNGADALTTTALGVIAYLIGGSITASQLRRTGRVILGTLFGEVLGAAVAVWIVLALTLPDAWEGVPATHLALAFAAVASTTAPAATVAVLHQYRARGPLSDTLLGVVALDDAMGIALFAIVLVVSTGVSLAEGATVVAVGLGGSLLLGLAGGALLWRLARHVHERSLHLPLVLAGLLLAIGVAESTGLSSLLAAMSLGFTARTLLGASGERLLAPVEHLEELVFLLFFTVAGAHFDPEVLLSHLPLVVAYTAARVAGKAGGAALGARLGGAPPQVSRWLGLCLVPQAGVAVGLALTLARDPVFAPASRVFVNVILASTLLYELAGPLAVRFALSRANELGAPRERLRT